MDWFKEKIQETIDFPIKIMGLSGLNFPLNQSIGLDNQATNHLGHHLV